MNDKKISEKVEDKKVNVNKENVKTDKTKKSNKRPFLVLLFLIIISCAGFIAFRGSYLEKMEIGEQYVSVFWTNFEYKSISLLITFTILFFSIFAANKRIYSGLKDFYEDEKKAMPKLPNKSISLVISVLVSIITSNITANKLMLFLNSTSFESTDPIFNNDIGYYLFQKPFLEYIVWFGIITLVALTIYMGIYYVIALNTQFDGVRSETLKKSKIVKQLLFNAKILAILIAVLTFFKTQDLSSSKFLSVGDKSSYSLYGAGIADVSIKLWGYRLLSIIIVISVFMAVSFYNKGKTKKVIGSILTVPIYLCLLGVTLIGYNSIFINSNELDKQKNYIAYNIENTREAYDIQIDEISVNNAGTLTNKGTLSYVKITSGKLTSSADNVGTVTNNGTFEITGGNISSPISGSGIINITGDTTNSTTHWPLL